jgi:hypothetical protein
MQEDALREKGIEPETEQWPRRSRNWALAHEAVYDERTGKLVQKKKQIDVSLRELIKTIAEVQEGTFQPDRDTTRNVLISDAQNSSQNRHNG